MHSKSFNTGGPIDPQKEVYILRNVDKKVIAEIRKQNKGMAAFSILGTRQSGKTSLRNHLKGKLKSDGWQFVDFDLRALKLTGNTISHDFVRLLNYHFKDFVPDASLIEEQSPLLPEIKTLGASLADIDANVAIYIDEVDNIANDSLCAMALCELIAASKKEGKGGKIVWITSGLLHLTQMVGSEEGKYSDHTEYELANFSTEAELIDDLSEGFPCKYQKNENLSVTIKKVLTIFGGQPFLTNLALSKLASSQPHAWSRILSNFLNTPPSRKIEVFLTYIQEALEINPVLGIAALDSYQKINKGIPFNDQFGAMVSLSKIDDITNLLCRSGLCVQDKSNQLIISSRAIEIFCGKTWQEHTNRRLMGAAQKALEQDRHQQETLLDKDNGLPVVVVLNAGGTLGMEHQDGKMVSPDEFEGVPWYYDHKLSKNIAQVELEQAFQPTDGANIGPPHWVELANTIYRMRKRKIAGVVIMHGTDTLAYTASYLSFALNGCLNFPVVFTGSQAPHAVTYGDAEVNFLRALVVTVELSSKLSEVCVSFNDEIYRATRVEKRDDFRFGGFFSPSLPPLAVIGEKIVLSSDPHLLQSKKKVDSKLQDACAERVLKIALYPGMLTNMWMPLIKSEPPPQGILLEGLGLGNVSTQGEYSVEPLLKEARARNIPVLVSSRYPIQDEFVGQYDAASLPLMLGAIRASNMAPAAALTKFFWTLGLAEQKISLKELKIVDKISWVKSLMEKNIAGELEV